MPQHRIRVLHVGKFYPPASGGMEKIVQLLCERERAVVDSQVLVLNQGRRTVRESVNGVPVTRVGTLGVVGSVAVCPTFPAWMRRLTSDVMVVHEPNPVGIVAHALVRPPARVVVWFHSEVVRPEWRYRAFYRPFLRRMLRIADRIVVASPRLADHARELQDFRDKCVAIPFGIDTALFAPTDERAERAQAIRRIDRRPLILFVGRMVPYKGVDVLLEALAGVDARAMLVGDGPLKTRWQQLAADLGLGDRVQWCGEVGHDELAALYHACDLFVLPSVSRAEAFGVVQLEAMACGKPVISTMLASGVPWVNQHGETGLVVAPGDATALREAIRTLIADEPLRRRMGARGGGRVASEFTIPRMIEQTTALYRSIVDRPASRAGGLAISRGATSRTLEPR